MLIWWRHSILFVVSGNTVNELGIVGFSGFDDGNSGISDEIDDPVFVDERNISSRFYAPMALNAVFIQNRLNIPSEIHFC